MLARFRHRNIVRVERYFEANGTAYLVMEYEDGESLTERLERGEKPGEDELERILFPLLEALRLVHRAKLLHRDIKPDNIYLRKDGSPLLLDFGAARHALGRSEEHTSELQSH